MLVYLDDFLNLLKETFQLIGVIFITYKSFHAIWHYITSLWGEKSSERLRFYRLKFDIGTGVVAGLELIVVGDVIETTIDQNYPHLITLALIVLIRTAINFFLEKDLQSIPEKDRIAIQNM